MSDFRVSLAPSRLDQTINPWTWNIGPMSLFSVNLGQSSDPELESRLLEQVGSYGRQIGQIGDALKTLIDHLEAQHPALKDDKAIGRFRDQIDHIAKLKDARKLEKGYVAGSIA